MGCKAEEAQKLQEAGDKKGFERLFKNALFQPFMFKLRAKAEMVQDEMRMRISTLTVNPVDYKAESRRLLKDIEAY